MSPAAAPAPTQAPPPPVEGPARPAGPGGKGRPTPKRREAERARRTRVQAPRDRKEAYRLRRAQAREERARARSALLRGDESSLPARDRGPVRRLVRDLVDSRRSPGEFLLFVALAALLVNLFAPPAVQLAVGYLWLAVTLLVAVDSLTLGIRLRRELERRLPGEPRRGAVRYGLVRNLQLRRLRLPPPRVKPGQPA